MRATPLKQLECRAEHASPCAVPTVEPLQPGSSAVEDLRSRPGLSTAWALIR
jgi:hypothetical protein